jgi:hypothetical protein
MEMTNGVEIEYKMIGDYKLPNLYTAEKPRQLGRWAHARERYLMSARPLAYRLLKTSGRLVEHLYRTEQEFKSCMKRLCQQMAEREGITEELKANDQMAWVRKTNNIHNRAEEMLCAELIYC